MRCIQCGAVMQSKVVANRPYKRKLIRFSCACGHEQTESPGENLHEEIEVHYASLKEEAQKFCEDNGLDAGYGVQDEFRSSLQPDGIPRDPTKRR